MSEHILVLSPRFPWPLIGGDRVKLFHLLKYLGRHYRVTLVTFSHLHPPTPEQLTHIEALGITVHHVVLNPSLAGIASIRTLWTGLPLEVAFYTRPDFTKIVDTILLQEKVDIGIAFFMRTAEYLKQYPNIHKVLIAEDSRVEYQQRSYRASRSPLQRLVRWWEYKKLINYEREIVNHFKTSTFVSRNDIEAVRTYNPSADYALVTNGVDLDTFRFKQDQTDREGLLFAGKLDVQANHLMGMTIVQSILPLVKLSVPNVLLHIVGSNPRNELVRSVQAPHNIHKNVPEMVPYLHRAAVFVHPHRGASGIQNKILEAMASGCAVVTTPSGIQGIDVAHGVHCLIGVTDEEIAQHVVTLLNDPKMRDQLAVAARKQIETNHHWDRIAGQLQAVLNQGSKYRKPVVHESTFS